MSAGRRHRGVRTPSGEAGRQPFGGRIKHPGEVIFTPTASRGLRARLAASCSLVSLAVQSLRSM
ncbi:hypothetical protein CP967_14075 [Streptomyces nitrosporeus]|uniref:Uncharacterized protein n=1 Tax=Streptomyces nitrosporeus TaxID=28894 RepID=A0A5J6FDB0_9ACTN|nr:hypothetical protein CP967_14075 [Streptomyces nitrosporeus]